MGAQQSTRRLTLDNDDPTNVIKVSDAVVARLRRTTDARNSNAPSTTLTAGNPAPVSAPTVPAPPPSPATTRGIAGGPLYPQYLYEGNQTSLQVRQCAEAALKENDNYWQNRIVRLEETHEKMNKLMKKEYDEAVQEVNDGFHRSSTDGRKPACVEGRNAVMACYKKYPNESMRCAREVQAFADCVDKHRKALVSNRE